MTDSLRKVWSKEEGQDIVEYAADAGSPSGVGGWHASPKSEKMRTMHSLRRPVQFNDLGSGRLCESIVSVRGIQAANVCRDRNNYRGELAQLAGVGLDRRDMGTSASPGRIARR